VAAAQKLGSLNREQVRARFEDRWTARRMAEDYVSVYAKLGQCGTPQLRAVGD
ncbi:MAG: glycosyltransferase family 4 protein, partial [Acetobacteraceae bacterium]|nr:glycosyltransferase family 4 protein [Acetobacteraceae bacterium]